ncbi:hypothetical protein DAPPUDRAFT_115563 [Daphnia pulex]|uniref:Uncharacterized protein n=1 Tax=Daphnia pulex TaxID=6669 RepID=E9HLT5_DAPPU|nr:hypothetical protein DAPPUDRAFT_115563 [Daphnia pulex]|eukprot:EFX67286.1 hypothetical protein DAPPUDRAFT_115563 [Daphnia pulex]
MNPGIIFPDHKLPNNKQLKKNAREQRWLDNKRKKKIKIDYDDGTSNSQTVSEEDNEYEESLDVDDEGLEGDEESEERNLTVRLSRQELENPDCTCDNLAAQWAVAIARINYTHQPTREWIKRAQFRWEGLLPAWVEPPPRPPPREPLPDDQLPPGALAPHLQRILPIERRFLNAEQLADALRPRFYGDRRYPPVTEPAPQPVSPPVQARFPDVIEEPEPVSEPIQAPLPDIHGQYESIRSPRSKTLLFYTYLDEAIEPEVFHPQVYLSEYESDVFFSGKSESESGKSESESDTESQQESDKEEGTDKDTKMDNIKKQEKARARKKRYLKNKKSKKQKLDIDDLPKKFKEQCSTDEEIEPEIFLPQTDHSDHESEPDYFSGQSESESGNENQQESDTEGTDEDTQNMTKKQEKARARKKRYLKNKKSKKPKLDIDNQSKKFKEECSTAAVVNQLKNGAYYKISEWMGRLIILFQMITYAITQDTKMDLENIKKQEKARARKKRYLQNKKNKKQKLEIVDLPKKFAEQCSTDYDPVKEHKAYREAQQNDAEEEDVDSQEEIDSNYDLGDYDYAETSSDSIESLSSSSEEDKEDEEYCDHANEAWSHGLKD